MIQGNAGNDALTGAYEAVVGRSFSLSTDDETTGNTVNSGTGNDTGEGSGGTDTLRGGTGNDTLTGRSGNNGDGDAGAVNLSGDGGADADTYFNGEFASSGCETSIGIP